MLIRSQNKHSLINFNNIARLTAGKAYGNNETDWLIEVDRQPFTECLGQYSTEAKAIKVLNKIQEQYARFSCRYGGDHSEDAIFQMPSDEEVEG